MDGVVCSAGAIGWRDPGAGSHGVCRAGRTCQGLNHEDDNTSHDLSGRVGVCGME